MSDNLIGVGLVITLLIMVGVKLLVVGVERLSAWMGAM